MNIRAILLGTAAVALLAGPAAAKSSDTDMRLDQLEQMVRDQNAEIQALKAGESGETDDAQALAATQAQVEALQNQMYEGSAATKSAWWQNTKISGRVYFDVTNLEEKTNGVADTNQKGYSFDIKRFYLGVDHKFDDMFSANVTTDFTYDSTTKATQLYIKKAYLDINVDPALDIRLGATDLPWVPFAEGMYGYRYVENTLIDRVKIGTSADWGVHANGKFFNGIFAYAVSVINGSGYKAPSGAGNPVKFKSVDVEGRLSATYSNFTLAVGGYTGKLGNDKQGTATINTATRLNALAAYTDDNIRVGVEYFSSKDWFSVTTGSDRDNGWSGFASYKFDPQWGVFGRYDMVHEKKSLTNKPRDNYYNVGIEWTPAKVVSLSLVYKHETDKNGTLSNQNGDGTLGVVGGRGAYNEIGLFGLFQF